MYNSGDFFESIVLKQVSTTSDGAGGTTNAFSTVGTYRAKVERLEFTQSENWTNITLGQNISVVVRFKEFTLTYNDKYKITWDSKDWVVKTFKQEGKRGDYLRIECYNEY